MKIKALTTLTALLLGIFSVQSAQAAIALDRTRVIYNGVEKSMSVNINNNNKTLPYLAQTWLEDTKGNKITSPITPLPPIQRVEPGAKSQIKLQGLETALHALPQDRESLYYFNVREIPPKSSKPNTLQLALQTRVKLFYRPAGLEVDNSATPFQEKITLTKTGNGYTVNNPTPYYITLINVQKNEKTPGDKNFQPLMVAPKGQAPLGASMAEAGSAPVVTYINDFGGRPKLVFSCSGSTCKVARSIKR
ncbi:fimbria/pilus periplasmic chaperone [Klebsiella aerogenes]|uniref:fimbria/pilus periplasmic chaperone n=1 Tax=Klebsiella aerogenes TaxID=548 RepID=UPI00351CCC10